MTVLMFTLLYLENKRVYKIKKYPFISFLISSYNDIKYIEKTIISICAAYYGHNFEIIVTNDGSTDRTKELLESIKEKFNLKIIHNKHNIGKVKSINNMIKISKGEILCILDSDTEITKDAIEDVISRFDTIKDIGAISNRYKVRNKGFLPKMQDIEYCFLAVINGAFSYWSSISLFGGCMFFKRKALFDIGLLSENAIIEDMDAALKLNELGYSVKQSFHPAFTISPDKLDWWINQKIRWSAGAAQCFIKHFSTIIKQPLSFVFVIFYSTLSISFIINIITQTGFSLLKIIMFSLLTLPYVIMSTEKYYKIYYIIHFTLVYYPLFCIVSFIGIVKGIYKTIILKDGERGW